jgi:hypothetical protein
MRSTHILCALFAFAIPYSGLASGPNHSVPQTFSVHDLDRDGSLSREEYAALRSRCQDWRGGAGRTGRARCDPARLLDFDALDADHDGHINEDELMETLGRRYRAGGAGR